MTYPTVFANLAAGNQPAALFDTMFNICGNQGLIACTNIGTVNALSLSPNANFFVPASYVNFQSVIFAATGTSTGPMTAKIGTLGAVNVFTPNLSQASTGAVVNLQLYILSFNQALNAGAGGFVIMSNV